MRALVIGGLAALVLFSGAPSAPGAPGGLGLQAQASSSCTRARIGPRIECLARNKRCRPRYETAYRHYGFTCKRAHDGLYRLKERVFIGPPRPMPPAP
jgi:hypothetical protein